MLSKLSQRLLRIQSWREIALVTLVLVYSGNPAPGSILSMDMQLVTLALFFLLLLLKKTRQPITSEFTLVVIIFAIILFEQCITFTFYPFTTISGFFIRLFIGYALLKVIKKFPIIFVQTMVLLSLLSFLFYIPYLLFSVAGVDVERIISSLSNLLGSSSFSRRPLLLHTFLGDFSPRNCGMFWEPGAFAGYLNLAMIFLAITKTKIEKSYYKRYFIILSLALGTTLSTTGYIIYPLVLLLHRDWSSLTLRKSLERILLTTFIIIPTIILFAVLSYQNFDFIGNKIEKQIQTVEHSAHGWHKTRFGSLLLDVKYIKQRPLTGWGLHSQTRYYLHPWLAKESQGMGNGFSDFTAKFGLIGMGAWLTGVFIGFKKFFAGKTLPSVLSCFIIILLLQGEAFLNYPFFLGMVFLPSTVVAYLPKLTRRLRISRKIKNGVKINISHQTS